MFSQTAEYALRAIVWLAENEAEGPVGNQVIAEGTQVSVSYLAKVMQELVKAEIVASRRGVGGGFQLVHRPEDITVLAVIDAVDPIRRYDECPLNLKTHSAKRCAMHASLDEAAAKVEETLSGYTIAHLLTDSTRPVPLVDLKSR